MNMENTDMLENLLQNSGKVDSELLALLSGGANEEEVQKLIAKKLVGVITALEVLEVKEALSEVLPFISQAYIAKTYFKKSRAWFTQRLKWKRKCLESKPLLMPMLCKCLQMG